MNFGHHPDPAIDFCLEVEAIENDITDRNAGIAPQIPDLGVRIERAMQFKVGGDTSAVVAKNALRTIEAAFKAGCTAGVATRHPRCGYPYCACVGECFAASQPGVTAGVATDGDGNGR